MSQTMTSAMDQVTEQLRAEERRLVDSERKLGEDVRLLRAELRRVRAALAALRQTGRATKAKNDGQPTALTTRDVLSQIEEVLSKSPGLQTDALRATVERRAKSAGHTLIGFHLRFAKAIKDDRILVDGDACRLRSDSVSRIDTAERSDG